MTEKNLYESADFFLGRTSLFPCNAKEKISYENCLDLIKTHPKFAEAIAIASPNLYQSLQKMIDSKIDEKKLKKIYQSLLKYFLRMSYRATPFGSFSYVWWGEFKPSTSLQLEMDTIEKSVHPDMEWIHLFIETLEKHQDFVKNLKVMVNPLILKEGERYFLQELDSSNKMNLVSIKETSFTKQVFKLAKQPITYSQLENQLFSFFDQYDKQNTISTLWSIFQKKYLISELHLPVNEPFHFEKFIKTVASANCELNHSAVNETLNTLTNLQQLIDKYVQSSPGEGLSYLDSISAMATAEKKIDYPLQVVTFSKEQKKVSLSHSIQKTLEETADVLLLLTHQRSKLEHLNKYHRDFIEKYGTYRLIPVKEVISSIYGLGSPKNNKEKSDEKNSLLDSILSHHQFSESEEIVVDDFIKDHQDLLEKGAEKAPLSLELFFEIISDSPQEMVYGNYTLVMNPVVASTQAGCTFGRFLHLWDDSKSEQLRQFLRIEESLRPDIAFVEATFITPKPRTLNVCFHKNTRSFQLNLHYQNSADTTLDLDDIYVGARDENLYLYSKKLNKEILLSLSTAVNSDLAPPIVKFMLEVSEKNFSYFSPFIFSDFKSLFTPRVRYKNVILSPARWFFDHQNLKIDKNAERDKVEQVLKGKFESKKLPQFLFLSDFDNKLLIDRYHPDAFKILIDHYLTKGELIVFEAYSLRKNAEVQDMKDTHVSEFVVPLVKKQTNQKTFHQAFPSTQQIPLLERVKYSGQSDWIYVKLFLSTDHLPDFISIHLNKFISVLKEKQWIDRWFYIRYMEEKSHIRLRLHGSSEIINSHVLQVLTSWCMNCIHQQYLSDYSLHNYEREVERYGGPVLIELVEEFFCDDSRLCSQILEKLQKKLLHLPAECLAVLGIIHILQCFYSDASSMIDAFPIVEKDLSKLKGLRNELKIMVRLVSSMITKSGNLEEIEKISAPLVFIFEHFKNSEEHLKHVSHTLDHTLNEGITWNSKKDLVNSLIHMHCNRLLGIDQELEKKARVIAYYCLQNLKNLALV